MTSMLICRFILSLRKFDSRTICVTSSSGIRAHLPVIEFAAQQSDTLPSFLGCFSHPVHTYSDILEMVVDSDTDVYDISGL